MCLGQSAAALPQYLLPFKKHRLEAMVYFKITDGEVTRKFKVTPGEITFEQLKERITSLFPIAEEGSKDLLLKYRDADGDVISISSDAEFQEALSELPENHIWKLHIRGSRPAPCVMTAAAGPRRETVPSDFYFQHSARPFGGFLSTDPWFHGFRSPAHHHFSPWLSHSWSHIDREFDRMMAEHTRDLNALHNSKAATTHEEATGEKAAAVPKEGDAGSVSKGMTVKNFGLWEPKEFEGPFGTGRIIGPVGYYISWNSGDDAGEELEANKSAEAKAGEEGKSAEAKVEKSQEAAGKETEDAQ